jgi:hypothetical protein
VFNRHGIARLAVTAIAALMLAGVLAAGTATAADSPTPAKAEKVEKKSKPKAPKPEKPKKAKKSETVTAAAPKGPKPEAAPRVAKVRPPEKSYAERRAEDGPWAKGANWLVFGAGYARAGGQDAGDGLGGYGIGYEHMLSNKWSFGARIHHDVLGHLGKSYEVAVPFTAEFVRHYKWKTVMRPFLGLGGGYYFHKYYRTGADYTGAPGSGYHVTLGTDLPIDDRHLLGLETRIGIVKGRGDQVVNPVFGPEANSLTIWSVKLNWALVY